MADRTPSQNRFFVRMGGKGWMVYDRERKGPAAIGSDLAENLTKERAERLQRMLASTAASGVEDPKRKESAADQKRIGVDDPKRTSRWLRFKLI